MRGGELKHVMKEALARRAAATTSWTGRSAASARRWAPGCKRELAPRAATTLLSRGGRRAPRPASTPRRSRALIADARAPTASTAPTACWRCINLEIWAACTSTARAPRTWPTSCKAARRMKILYVCHRFPFPPKRGGKIRPFNMIRHLSRAAHEVTVGSLARSQAEARGGRGPRAALRALRDGRVSTTRCRWLRMVARLPTPTPSSIGLLPLAAARSGASTRLLARERFDLIFVHCSSVAQYVAARARHAEDPRLRRHGLAEVAASTRSYKPFPLSLGYWLEGRKLEREERRLARALRPVHRDHARGVGDARGATAPARRPTGFRTAWTATTSRRRTSPTTPTRSCFVGRMDYYPNQECMFDFCARRAAAAARAAAGDQAARSSAPIRRRQMRKLGELPGVTVTGSVPDVRPVRAPVGADGGAAQHRARHAEQDPRSRWRWACRS